MSTDLTRALEDIAEQAGRAAAHPPVDSILARRRLRRRAVRAAGTGALVVVIGAGMGLVTAALPARVGPDLAAAPPAQTDADQADGQDELGFEPTATPGCGDDVSELVGELTLTVNRPMTVDGTGTVTVSGDLDIWPTDGVSLTTVLLVQDDTVVATADGSATADLDLESVAGEQTEEEQETSSEGVPYRIAVMELDAEAALTGCTGPVEPGEYQVLAFVESAGSTAATAPVVVTLSAATTDDPADRGAVADRGDVESADLPDPYLDRTDGVVSLASDPPERSWPVADGSYFAYVAAADPSAGTVLAEVYELTWGTAAEEYVRQHEPGLLVGGELPSGYHLARTAFGRQTVPVAEDAVIVGRRPRDGGGFRTVRQTLADLATTDATSAVAPYYWLDVRDGQVAQMTGQYLP